eukprot:scaffold4335_cov220-Pinguiococcus_pyrenoidosus.AAC.2
MPWGPSFPASSAPKSAKSGQRCPYVRETCAVRSSTSPFGFEGDSFLRSSSGFKLRRVAPSASSVLVRSHLATSAAAARPGAPGTRRRVQAFIARFHPHDIRARESESTGCAPRLHPTTLAW